MSKSEKVRWECDRCHATEHSKSSYDRPDGWATIFGSIKGDVCPACADVLRPSIKVPFEDEGLSDE